MITHNRLNDFSSVYKNYLNRPDSSGQTDKNSEGYEYYRFVPSPDAVVLFDFGRVKSADIRSVSNIWKALPGTNTPDAWKLKIGSLYSEIKRNDYADIEKHKPGNLTSTAIPASNVTSVKNGLTYKIIALVNKAPKKKNAAFGGSVQTPTPTEQGVDYVKNLQKDAGVSSESDFLTAVIEQGWLDSFRSVNPDSTGITNDFSSYNKLFQTITDTDLKNKITQNAVGVEWFGYFKPPDLSSQYSFTFTTSNGGNFMMWLGNKAVCEYTPSNTDITFPNVEFTPDPPIREPKYYPIRIQYYANANTDSTRVFSFGIKNLTTKDNLDLSKVLFTINDGNYFPKLQYLSFLSTSADLFAKGALTCYVNDFSNKDNMNTFYDFINSKKYETLNKINDQDRKTNNDQFAVIDEIDIKYSQVSIPNNPLSKPVVYSIYRLDADMRMNKTFQINTQKVPGSESYTINPVDDKLITPGNNYTTLANYYTTNPSAGINASADDCEMQCNESAKCNWYFAYQSNGTNRCVIDSKKSQPEFNQIRPIGGNTSNSQVDDKTSSLYLRNFSFPKSKGCGPNSVLLEESEPVLSTTIYTETFPYSTYIMDPKVIDNVNKSGKCSDAAYLKLNAEAKNILSVNTLYQEDGKYKDQSGVMRSKYPDYTDTTFWSNIKEPFTNTNALSDTKKNALDNIAKERRLGNTNEQINSTYSDLSSNINNYNNLRTFMENDVNYDLSGNTLLHFRNTRKPTLREQNALDSNAGGLMQNSIYVLGTITAASLLILAVLLGRE